MDSLLDKIGPFLGDYYVIFMIISGILLLALIGFVVTGKKKKTEGVQTADPMTQQPSASNAEMPSAPMGGEMPAEMSQAPEMNTAAVTPEATQPTLADVATPVEPVTPAPGASVEAMSTPDTTSVVEPNTVPMEPIAPANSDEPTLIIEDKSAVPQEAATLFETPNATPEAQAPVEPIAAPEVAQPMSTDAPAPAVESTSSESVEPVTSVPSVPTEPVAPSAPAEMAPEPAASAPDVQPEAPTTSIFENQ